MGLSALEWSWLRFAPLTVLGVASIGALLGGVWQVLGELNVDLEDSGAARSALDWLTGRPVAAAVVSVTAAVLVAGSLGAVALYVEAWWGYRLTRRRDGTLRVNRGLLTKRSVSLEERRLRGVEVTEPLLLRAGRGARCTAVATGSGSGDRASLLPPAPRAEAHRVAAAVLHPEAWWQHHLETGDGTGGGGVSPTEAVLERHPGAALRRRLARAVVPAVVVVAVLGYGDGWGALPSWPWVVAAVVLVPVSVLLGLDRYRNLGHLVTDEHLIVRSGSLVRRTVALRRTGIIGWQVSQSVFQRQAGLATATAVTAAGAGAYDILDVDLDRAMDLGERLAVRQQTT